MSCANSARLTTSPPPRLKTCAARLGAHGGQQQRFDAIVDVGEVAALFAAPDFDRLPLEQPADPDADECLPRVFDPHARAVSVRETQGAGGQIVNVVVQDVVELAGQFVDAVDVDGAERVPLIDGEPLGPAVNLPRAGKHDADPRVDLPARFQDRKLRAAVDLQVGERILHRIEMARLAGEVEQEVLAVEMRAQAIAVAHVGDVHADAILDPLDVESVAAVFGHQAVDQRDLCARNRPAAGPGSNR